jgi:hypothetical protein
LAGDFVDFLALPGDDANVKIFLFTGEAERTKIAAISSAANDEIYADRAVDAASHRWFRLKWSSVQKYRDGLTMDAAGLPPVATAVVKTVPQSWLNWLASRQPKDAYAKLMLSAPLIGILAVRDRYDQEDCMRAGRVWQRAHLLAAARGLAGRPCNEAVEMIDYERAHRKPAQRGAMLAEVLGDASWQPTFVFYMGYPLIAAHASPRRPVSWVATELRT